MSSFDAILNLCIFLYIIVNIIFYIVTLIAIKKSYDQSNGTNIFYYIVFLHGCYDICKIDNC